MNISCAPRGIVAFRHPKQGIGDIAGTGFKQLLLDLSAACPSTELEYIGTSSHMRRKHGKADSLRAHPENLYEYMYPVLEQCRARNLLCLVARAPYLKWNTTQDSLNTLVRRIAVESIRICGQASCQFLIVQPLFVGIPDQDLWKCNRTYYLELADIAKQADVQILLENQCKDLNGHLVRGVCSDGRQAAQWVDRLNEEAGEERFGFCMDVGVCNLCGQNMYDFILALGSRLKAVILRDNDGNSASALLPFTAARQGQPQTDWLNLIRGLREIGFDGELILDIRDTASAFSPLLRPGLLQMAKSVADYFKWQIEIENQLGKYPSRVLFGAGNMCRNYMKCYGEKYPPLFTCDNNRNIWETEFCGLTVKSPEMLKTLPEDCAVFICNIYYREIESQLRQMGIKNPIAFFNDEYMPSFYFDRVDREKP
ncbi:MAG: sugar phosphate isomerase/epimerase [Lachnospiraceae bacterium]|nr:sugar phosphate isomerase/epimerase [Lachnospiraceae bacterium]